MRVSAATLSTRGGTKYEPVFDAEGAVRKWTRRAIFRRRRFFQGSSLMTPLSLTVEESERDIIFVLGMANGALQAVREPKTGCFRCGK